MMRFLCLLALLVGSTRADFECETEGIFPDPDACQNFIQCQRGDPGGDGEEVSYIKYVTACPQTELFAECDLVCEFEDDVDCGARPRPDGSSKNAFCVISQENWRENV